MTLAAPAVAIANQNKTMGHTAPLLPTPPIITLGGTNSGAGLAGIAPGIPAAAAGAVAAAAAAAAAPADATSVATTVSYCWSLIYPGHILYNPYK